VVLALDQPAPAGRTAGNRRLPRLLPRKGASIRSAHHVLLGGQGALAVTGDDGRATATFFLLAQPDSYTLHAALQERYVCPGQRRTARLRSRRAAVVVDLEPAMQFVPFSFSAQVTATVTSGGLPLAGKPVALT